MSRVTKTAWDVMSGVANLCGMFCTGWQKMAWDVLSRDVLSGSHLKVMHFGKVYFAPLLLSFGHCGCIYDSKNMKFNCHMNN